MKEFLNLDLLTQEDTASVAIALLYTLKNNPKYSILSELPYIVDYQNFINLVNYYGGMEIRIPTSEELTDIVKILLLYQNYKVKNKSWADALRLSGFSSEESNSARGKLTVFEKMLKSQEIGGRQYD